MQRGKKLVLHIVIIWLVTEKKEVLLQKDRTSRNNMGNVYGPIEGFAGAKELIKDGTVVRLVKEGLGEKFQEQYPFSELKQKNEISIVIGCPPTKSMRHHFYGPVSEGQVRLIPNFKEIILIGKDDLPRVKSVSNSNGQNDIVLWNDKYETLLEILGVSG